MIEEVIILISLAAACIPAFLFSWNLFLYRRAPRRSNPAEPTHGTPQSQAQGRAPRVSVLIPARNEEAAIDAAIESVLSNRDFSLELLVLDDHSSDSTPEKIDAWSQRDARVRRIQSDPLPSGWCGKPFACDQLGRHAVGEWLLYLDADVRLSPDAVLRMVEWAERGKVDLLSGVPRQITGTVLEKLLIPLIHFVLLGFLPMMFMRWSGKAGFAAGCGQLFLARRSSYLRAGGHTGLRRTLHDGLELPRAFRKAGFKTDLFDATDLARCRMYVTNGDTWHGLGKNATEGMGAPGRIVPFTLLLGMGQVAPVILAVWTGITGSALFPWAVVALLLGLGIRALSAWRFRQSLLSVVLHPVGVLLLLSIQWQALWRKVLGRPMAWKGRQYPAGITG